MIMATGRFKLQNVMDDGLSRDLMDAGRFCFSCEQIFANRRCLEEHMCSAASFICSCGTEFTEYTDMEEHSTTHEPGHQVLDHETIRKRRYEKRMEEERQLKRLQTGEVVWKAPKMDNVASISLPVKPKFQVSMHSASIPQVPESYPSPSQESFPNPFSSSPDMKNIFANVGAPTVDLWTLYQPVVLIKTVRKFNKKRPYTCGKCGQGFMTKTSLMSHHSSHVTDKVSGCIGCGLLLSSKKLVPRFHVCNSPNNATKFRIITADPLKPNPGQSQNPRTWDPQTTSFLQVKNQNHSASNEVSQVSRVTSTLPLKNQNVRTYNRSNQGISVALSQQSKSPTPISSKFHGTASFLPKSQSPSPIRPYESSQGLPVTLSGTSIKSASGLASKPTKTPSASNGFTCRVCHISFDSAHLLQRHKCAKAQEFMAQHGRAGKQQLKIRSVTPMMNSNLAQMNGERKLGAPASGNIKKNQIMAVTLDKGQGPSPAKGKIGADVEDDCYIVESGPDKPAEMIYQVTSSVPIKT
ncbi:GDNF-inducible zinc finger protein 1-like [Sparus aurata]|uniref:GDNF-inducible zinc finger protein 1-like n=1 Tax=Sparus aurata TaxID=8175 RepID=UPI0011C195AF|nr:GDNF-inducible zinc finger protein 1-like [Sparus aurata]XP_030249214.1 GDNF-inducible zinc finger protein 1-like [Sparus aurata]